MLIDTHCHLSFKAFDKDWEDVVLRAQENDIQMVCVGAAKETSEKSITIAKKDGVFAAIGVHPTHVEDEDFDYDWFMENSDNPKVVAIGETGIDHYHIDRIISGRHPELDSGSLKQSPQQALRFCNLNTYQLTQCFHMQLNRHGIPAHRA